MLFLKTFLPPLTPKEEQYYLEKMNQGDLEARSILIERNLRLVVHICKKYQNIEEDLEDFISIGTIGLIKGISTFVYEKGNRLATYAARCIENEILMYLRSRKKTTKEISLYEPIGTDKEGNQIELLDTVESNEIEAFDLIEQNGNIKRLYYYLPRVLTKREWQILILRYGLYCQKPVTQREIAKKMGISRSYVSRIEKRALEKLKQAFDSVAWRYGYDHCEDSTRVLTLKVKDREHSRILHSCDFAIVYNCSNGNQQYIRHNKEQGTYTWEYQPKGFIYLPEKIDWLKENGLWGNLLDYYIIKKNYNTNPDKHSRSLFAESINELCRKHGFESHNK